MRQRQREVRSLYWVKLVMAVLLMIAPLLFGFTPVVSATRNAWDFGVIIGFTSMAEMITYSVWEEWASFIWGLWVAMSPWVLGFHAVAARAMRIHVVLGFGVAVVAVLQLWNWHHAPKATSSRSM